MDCWLPRNAAAPGCFRKQSRLRRVVDFAKPDRQWRFAVDGAYIPRGVLRNGEDLRVRFSLRNLSRHGGTVYYVVNLRNAYENHGIVFSTDLSGRRSRYTASVAAGQSLCIEVAIPWQDLQDLRSGSSVSEMTLAVEIEIWTPRWLRTDRQAWRERLLRIVQKGMFQKVQLMHNPILLFTPAVGSCFISYAWRGRAGLAENDHRAWAYRLADALALAGYQPVIDFNFLAPALINEQVIERKLGESRHIILVYSDDYVERRDRASTGVGFEYGLISSRADLWAKTIPVRRALYDREGELFGFERRYVASFEEGDVTANAAVLMHVVRDDSLD